MRAAYEEQMRAGNSGGMKNHANHKQRQSTDAYYGMETHMTPQSSPGHSLSPTRSQKKGTGKTKTPGNSHPQDFNAQAQNWQNQQVDTGYVANNNHHAKKQGSRGAWPGQAWKRF